MDNRLKKQYMKLYLLCLIVLLIGISAVIYYYSSRTLTQSLKHVNGTPLSFNYESGFYNNELNVTIRKNIELPINSKIYYTLNGDDPKITDTLYEGNIKLELDETQTKVVPLKARLYYNDECSDIYQRTYVIDKNIENRFDINVISITSDSYNLYDYYNGILVEGYSFDTAKEKNPNVTKYQAGNYRNRTDEWLRDCHVNVFEKNGESLIDDNFKFGISGAYSSGLDVKSFKIISKDEDKIIFTYNEELSKLSIINEYNSLKFRAGGTDGTESNIRESVFSKLAEMSNFDGYFNSKRAILFLNGKFYGIFNIEQNYSNSFLGRRFYLNNSDNIVKLKGNLDLNLEKIGIFNNKEDINNEEIRNKLEEKIDIDDYLLYMAIELIANNEDWPYTNSEIWYYDNTKGKEQSEYSDGKVRCLLYDMDMAYYSKNLFDENYNKLKNVISENTFFSYLMNSKYYRDKFITLINDLLNTSFKDENLIKIIDEEYLKIEKENKLQKDKEEYNYWINSVTQMKKNALYRNQKIINSIEEIWKLNEKYNYSIVCGDGIKAYWNNMEVFGGENYSNEYYKGVKFIINYEEYPGYKFDYWLVNEKKIYDNELEINDELIENNQINIELITKKDNSTSLIISEISAKNDSDWIKLVNVGDNDVILQDYCISDNINKLKKYQLPNLILKPNESIIFNGNKNYFSIGDFICNFNLSKGETVYLFDNNDEQIKDKLLVPRMSSIETYGRYLNSNTFMFFNNIDNKRKISEY